MKKKFQGDNGTWKGERNVDILSLEMQVPFIFFCLLKLFYGCVFHYSFLRFNYKNPLKFALKYILVSAIWKLEILVLN